VDRKLSGAVRLVAPDMLPEIATNGAISETVKILCKRPIDRFAQHHENSGALKPGGDSFRRGRRPQIAWAGFSEPGFIRGPGEQAQVILPLPRLSRQNAFRAWARREIHGGRGYRGPFPGGHKNRSFPQRISVAKKCGSLITLM